MFFRSALIITIGFLLNPLSTAIGQEKVDFQKHVVPILKKHCAACHNQEDYEAGFSVDSYSDLEEGSDGEAVFIAGEPDESLMIQLMTGESEPLMPPDDQLRPTDKEIAILKKWIEQGAEDSKDDPPKKEKLDNESTRPAKRVNTTVTSADWSAQNIVAVARYQSVELINGATKKSLAILNHTGKVNSVRFAESGQYLVSGGGSVGQGGEAKIWDVANQKVIATFQGHSDAIYSAVLSPNEKLLATASYDRKIKIWDVESGNPIRDLAGHNDAVLDLQFSRDSKNLISASADQTIKVWHVESGQRLDTLGQPLKAQLACRVSPNNQFIVAAGRDNRIRVWQFVSRNSAKTNPLLIARFAHEAPIVQLQFDRKGSLLISTSEDQTIKIWQTPDFQQIGVIKNQPDVCSAVAVSPNGETIFVGRLDGSTDWLELPKADSEKSTQQVQQALDSTVKLERKYATVVEQEPNDHARDANSVSVPVYVNGTIDSARSDKIDTDLFRFQAKKGSRLVIETKAARDKSPLDSKIQILDVNEQPIPRVLLQAVRDSYFTFRGKNTDTADDFRIHNWEEMELNNYLYCNGEVVKLFQHPRGPDSGFLVYPGTGKRHGYFGTTPVAHALHEPCYVVRPVPVGTPLLPNGLPTFQINYENDDDSKRKLGRDSKLIFNVPNDGEYLIRVSDVRGFQGKGFKYQLTVRPVQPDFKVSFSHEDKLQPGSGKELTFRVDRIDGFEGPVQIELPTLPNGYHVRSPVIIEAGQYSARIPLHVSPNALEKKADYWTKLRCTATATIGNTQKRIEIGGWKELKLTGNPKVQIRIVHPETTPEEAFEKDVSDAPVEFTIRPGETVEGKLVVNRIQHQARISFGQADAGRNLPHGVYVDNIGLNGLMITRGNSEQRFFLTAEKWVQPQERLFHVRANDVEGQVSLPVRLRVLPSIAK